MSRACSTLAAAMLAISATAAMAQNYPLTNGPNGAGPNAPDSQKGFIGGNAVAPEREFLYHPERAGNAAAALGITAQPEENAFADDPVPDRHRVRRHRRHMPLR